jgi:hypothetical protein
MAQTLWELDGIGMLFKSSAFFPILGLHILAGLACLVTGIVRIASAVPARVDECRPQVSGFRRGTGRVRGFPGLQSALDSGLYSRVYRSKRSRGHANRHRREEDWSQR